MTIAVVVFAVADVVIGDSDVAIALILVVDSVIAVVLMQLSCHLPLEWIIDTVKFKWCTKNPISYF